MAFMAGLVAGVWVFAEVYVRVEDFVTTGALETATLAEALRLPFWTIALAVGLVAVVTFRLVSALEARRRGSDAA